MWFYYEFLPWRQTTAANGGVVQAEEEGGREGWAVQ